MLVTSSLVTMAGQVISDHTVAGLMVGRMADGHDRR